MKQFLCIIFLFLIPLNPGHISIQITTYIQEGNIFDNVFTEPFETIVLVCKDGHWISFTQQLAGTVFFPLDALETKYNIHLEDVVIIMHNHFAIPHFSISDKNMLKLLRRRGFTGSFGIYITSTKKIILYEDDKRH